MNAPEDQNGLREALAREDLMVRLYAEGRTLREIAPIVSLTHGINLTHGGVQAALRRRGVVLRKKARRPDLPRSPKRTDWKYRALAAQAEITRLKGGMETRWRPMDTAPNDVPIYAKHKPNEHTPHGWIALIRRRAEDPDEGRGCGQDTILHYNGDASMRGFYGCWTGWLWPEELATLSPKDQP